MTRRDRTPSNTHASTPGVVTLPLFYALTLFVSALLLFLVEPMVGKMLLPLLGGTPAVWNTCMIFFQAMLLFGYLYAHRITDGPDPRRQFKIHTIVLALPVITMAASVALAGSPVSIAKSLAPQGSQYPVFGLLLVLTLCVGLPFFALSASAPLLQKWFSTTGHSAAKDPYFLYAASNVGSLLALLCYPFVIEPILPLATQSWMWAAGYAALAGLTFGCGRMMLLAQPAAAPSEPGKFTRFRGAAAKVPTPVEASDEVPWSRKLRWLGLAMVPSSLMLGVTTYLTTDVASIPLLWLMPLSLYLMTFIVAFSRVPPQFFRAMSYATPVLVLLLVFLIISGTSPSFEILLGLHLITFFAVGLTCHGELARQRPPARRLTNFYLWVSIGGVLGGVFNGLVAPIVFNDVYEYRLALVAACLFLPLLRTKSEEEIPPRANWVELIPLLIFLALAGFSLESSSEDDADKWHRLILPVVAIVAVLLGAFDIWLARRSTRREHVMGVLAWPLVMFLLAYGLINFEWVCNRLDPKTADGGGKLLEYCSDVINWLARHTNLRPARVIIVVTYGLPTMLCYYFVERPVRFGLAVLAVLVAAELSEDNHLVIHKERSFFGVLKVEEYEDGTHRLIHGTTLHGMQHRWAPDLGPAAALSVPLDPLGAAATVAASWDAWVRPGPEPLTYYHRTGPIGQVFKHVNDTHPKAEVALVGLGTGSLAYYVDAGQHATFYEIDPAVVRLSSDPKYFDYLTVAKARGANLEFSMGDARIQLERAAGKKYRLIIVDAFSSDAIPAHLLTNEAVQLYLDRLEPDGLLMLHISNRHLRLEFVVDQIARELGLTARQWYDGRGNIPGKTVSNWIVLSKDPAAVEPLLVNREWKPLKGETVEVRCPAVVVPNEDPRVKSRVSLKQNGEESLIVDDAGLSSFLDNQTSVERRRAAGNAFMIVRCFVVKEQLPELKQFGAEVKELPAIPAWRDDFSNIISVFRWSDED
jgi:hypothetical protein